MKSSEPGWGMQGRGWRSLGEGESLGSGVGRPGLEFPLWPQGPGSFCCPLGFSLAPRESASCHLAAGRGRTKASNSLAQLAKRGACWQSRPSGEECSSWGQ